MRLLSCVCGCALLLVSSRADAQWATVKGRVVFPEGKAIPERPALNVTQDKPHCLKDGAILDESVVVNPKNRGIKNVVVWLRPVDPDTKEFAAGQIHPDDAKRKSGEVVIDQPCCMFVPRVTAARVGDTLMVKNSAPVNHNFFWSTANNGECNVNIPAGGKHQLAKPLAAEAGPIQYKCTVHPWMTGYVRVFDHPYHAVTDGDGNFEIRNAPAGRFRIVFWHENGFRGGKDGRFGEVITIAGPTLEIKPVDFDVSPR